MQDAGRLVRPQDDRLAVAPVADLDGAVRRQELVRRAGRDDAAVAEDREPIGELVRLLQVVRRQQDRLAERAQAADRLPGLPARGRIEAGRRLVEEDELGIADEREREVEPAQLAAGERPDARVALLLEPDELEDLARSRGLG